ncbi:hypothetical protein HYPSUDRAFT_87898 [Hypholoma sublateritium FD-334 SS-4]|uniref:Mediator of RNA polymerase II transcription subunit 13 n=1 Tax=Hypholoma sublateritium (strain FD-334 SS-4) TaxID=945553 RepID=A0A0D2L4E9_HYPSF|nr:hypothetical protein HYPSUDRAFT_87898 [Hypholoma sublateritium FD-334 SS-4]
MSAHRPTQLADTLLAASLDLPALPAVAYVRFFPASSDAVELARKTILARNPSASSLLDLILPSVHTGPEPFLYAFKISTENDVHAHSQLLASLPLESLSVAECSSFTPPPSTSLLPNPDKRSALSYFYDAVRSRVIDDIVTSAACAVKRQVKRFRNGFLMSQIAPSSDWQYKAITRPLVFCQLQIHFSYTPDGIPSQLLIHPMLIPTPFLDIARSLPLPSGTPITLLPYGTPAYYLTSYTGPTTGLIKQFQSSLQGLGAGQWENTPSLSAEYPSPHSDAPQSSTQSPTFIIGWIKVENKQGEDKGIIIIYPTELCLSYTPHSSSRTSLDYIPELPAPLQPSPQVAPALPSLSDISQGNLDTPLIAPRAQRPAILTSPTSESLHSFRALTLSKTSDLRLVASEVGGYVDAVVRERERERERLKRERENGVSTSPRLVRANATTPAAMTTPTPSSLEASSSGGSTQHMGALTSSNIGGQAASLQTNPNSNTLAGPSTLASRSLPPQPPPPITLSVSMQNYYPSPPQGTPHTVAAPTSPAVDDPSSSTHGNALASSISGPHSAFPSGDMPSIPPETMSMPAVNRPMPAIASASAHPAAPSGATYDLYGMDSAGETYLSMDMDMDMDFGMGDLGLSFGMNVGGMGMDMGDMGSMGMSDIDMGALSVAPSGGGGGAASRGAVGLEFEDAFTDDDFSFFDRPPRAPLPSAPVSHFGGSTGAGIGSLMSPPATHFLHDTGMAQNAQHMWTPGAGDGATPLHHHAYEHEHLPGHGATDGMSSVPATPGVHLSPRAVTLVHGLPTPHDGGASRFDPIPFAASHRRADGKYAHGKFALALGVGLPSPPAEDDDARDQVPHAPASPGHARYTYRSAAAPDSSPGSGGWRLRYDAVTDPRIGVVRKLIGVKRKPGQHGTRDPQRTVPWAGSAAHEDWATPPPPSTTADGDVSEAESEEEEDADEDEDGPDTPLRSRPATPPPAYLPLGPALLPMHFAHAALLALSVPLRPPGSAILPPTLPGPGALPSVPTPVSPAATMGAASERGRSLEGAAQAVGEEVVANPVWAATWRAASVGARSGGAVWASDARTAVALLSRVPGVRAGLGLPEVFGLDSSTEDGAVLQPLTAPMISIGKGDAVIQVLPTAIRFWEKLGLDPIGGRKDVSAFVLFEDEGGQTQALVDTWVTNLRSTYQGKHFGTMSLGTSTFCAKDGFVPLKFDATFRKSFASFIASMTSQANIMLFFVLPITVMSLSSAILRQILSVVKKVAANYRTGQLIFQFIPEQHLFSSLEKPAGYESALDQLAFSVYDRVLVVVDRLRTQRANLSFGDDTRRYFAAPSFTLARPLHTRVSYARAAHASLDVLDRHTLLHVGYHLTACGKWIIATCVDQRGEAYETGVWLAQPPEGEEEGGTLEEYTVRRVWEFAMQFAKKTNVEWRVIFARLGVMSERELQAWTEYLTVHVAASHEQPPLHHTLVCVVPDAAWSFIPSKSSTTATLLLDHSRAGSQVRSVSASKQTPVYTDVSAMTYVIFPTHRIPISIPPSQSDLSLSLSLVPEPTSPAFSSPYSPQPYPHPSVPDTLYPPVQRVHTPAASSSANLVPSPAVPPHPITILPPYTALLIRVPHAASTSVVCTTAVHLLRTFHSAAQPHALAPPDDRTLLDEVSRNYYELAVLAAVRMRLDGVGGHRGLPLHLAAVDAMRMALDREWDRLEAVVEI